MVTILLEKLMDVKLVDTCLLLVINYLFYFFNLFEKNYL